jgi:hypothetical protein
MGLNSALSENALKQQEAAAAIAEATAQMIYQQASAGLDTQAALNLASAMGLLSEADYAVATVVETLRQSFDSNTDGMISAAEGSEQFAGAINAVYKAVSNLQTKNVPITIGNIAKEMEEMEAATQDETTIDTVEAISNAAPGISAFSEGMRGTGENADAAIEPTETVGKNIATIADEADPAATAVGELAKQLGEAKGPLTSARDLSGQVATNIGKIPSSKNISINTNVASFQSAITWLGNLATAIGNIPSSKTVNITLQTSGGGTAPTSGIPPGIGRSVSPGFGGAVLPTGEGALQYSVTNNIYNPLAAAILAEQQAQIIRTKFGALM